jgi:hypothetical protein
MSAELEKWIDSVAAGFDKEGGFMIKASDLRGLFDGKVLVPVDALNAVMELAGVALVYQPFGTKDRKHFDTLIQIAASQEQE